MAADASRPVRVLHVITGLETGGAEMMLYKLARALPAVAITSEVAVLGPVGRIAGLIEELDIPVHRLNAGLRLGLVLRLNRLIRAVAPDVVQAWMYHANVAATAAVIGSRPRPPVVWNIRATLEHGRMDKLGTRTAVRSGAILSRVPARIVYNSHTGAQQHAAVGYSQRRAVVIPNGFDLEAFRPDQAARERARAALGINEKQQVVLHVARFHPMKDHRTFFAAAHRVRREVPRSVFLLAGRGVTPENDDLMRMVSNLDLADDVRLLGERSDVASLLSAGDVMVSSSARYEGFSNVLGEAMAAGLPCVATDVGDADALLGESGIVVPPSDPVSLAAAISATLKQPDHVRRAQGARARRRIEAMYSIEAVSERYARLYAECGNTRRNRA